MMRTDTSLGNQRVVRRVAVLAAIACLSFAVRTTAQGPPPMPDTAGIREKMAPLARLAGCWTGEGSMRMGPGEPKAAVGTELIETRLDGTLVTVSGRFYSRLSDGSKGAIIHDAFAVIVPAPEGGYKFISHLATGMGAEMRGDLKDGKFTWSPPLTAGRRIRYVADWSVKDRWHEVGEFSPDGVTWVQFLEMKLERQTSVDACAAPKAGS